LRGRVSLAENNVVYYAVPGMVSDFLAPAESGAAGLLNDYNISAGKVLQSSNGTQYESYSGIK
jgi:hypothetical protein